MMGTEKPWEQKEVPWCSVCLVTAIVLCQLVVLIGNMNIAGAFYGIGTSTGGWSGVGLDLAESLHYELDELMKNVTEKLTGAINETMQVQEMIDMLLGLVGSATEDVTGSNVTKALFLLQSQSIQHAVQHGYDPPIGGMAGLITGTTDQLLEQLMTKVSAGLDRLLEVIKPALEQVGAFIIQFGDKVQAMLESFSVTLDKVQKIFDDAMKSLAEATDMEDIMVHNTFTLFDISNTGGVTANDLKLVAQTYKVSPLQGAKSDKLVQQYDIDGSEDLDPEEFREMVNDESVPGIMSVVLRTFSTRLAEVAGQLEGSKFRDEVAQNIVAYLQLMGAKNKTKVSWVSDMLTNGTLPLEFTGDVMVNLALSVDDPNVLTTADIGQDVISTCLGLHPKQTMAAYEQLSDPEYWHGEGYNPDDQAVVVERVTKWITKGSSDGASLLLQSLSEDEVAAGQGPPVVLLEEEVINAMPSIAKKLIAKRMKAHKAKIMSTRHARYNKLFSSKTSQKLFVHLLGGEHAADTDSASSPASRAVRTGVLAKPETMQFAQWLTWNATDTAARFNKYCFAATAMSSNSIDGFATVIQGMVKKVKSFINQMEKWSTPAGIEKLEAKIKKFAHQGLNDVKEIIKSTIADAVEDAAPKIEAGIHAGIQQAGNEIGRMIGQKLGTPIGISMKPVLNDVLSKMLGNGSSANAKGVSDLSDTFGDILGDFVGDKGGEELGKIVGDALDKLVNKAMEKASGAVDKLDGALDSLNLPLPLPEKSLLQRSAAGNDCNVTADPKSMAEYEAALFRALRDAERKVATASQNVLDDSIAKTSPRKTVDNVEPGPFLLSPTTPRKMSSSCDGGACLLQQRMMTLDAELALEDPDFTSGSWQDMIQQLKSFENVIPLAQANLKFARKEVSKLSKSLDHIFETFAEKGSPIFDKIGSKWRLMWTLYFCVFVPMTLLTVFYGFWAGGFFGGPGMPISEQDKLDASEPSTGALGAIGACCSCIRNSHDSHICFWSILIIAQIFALTMFSVSLVFILFTGIQTFVASGCAAIYIIGDPQICGSTLLSLREFLSSFMGVTPDEAFGNICENNQLLVCSAIRDDMKPPGLIAAAASFLATILTFQMLIESAALHTRAVERRRLQYMYDDESLKDKRLAEQTY